jgi:hydrogenase nickel incorporation protein HypB
LAELVGFQRERFYEALNEVRPGIPILEVSARSGEGIDEWVSHLETAKRSCKGMVSSS